MIEKKIHVLTNLKFERVSNRLWQLTDDFKVMVEDATVIVPAGFITDGASVPSFLWWFCAPVAGAFGSAAVVHDWMYDSRSPYQDREYADAVLYSIGRYYGAGRLRAGLVYSAVRIFGWKWWGK